jgi:glyoxylase-like metal-dependent hydrolase (beta-lactamase superfamily II)
MRIRKDVYKIRGGGIVYLILNPVPFVIDSGDEADRERIKSEIEKFVSIGEIKFVLLTHLHYDHSGNAGLFSHAEIYASEEEIEDFKKMPELFFFNRASEETVTILKNRLRPLPEEILGLKVFKVPGHTRGSVAFVDEKRKLLFSGDTIFCSGIGRTDFPNSAPHEMRNSVDKLRAMLQKKELKLCPGHDT